LATGYSLKEFQESLARRLREASSEPAPDSRLAVQSGGMQWLLKLDEVGEIMPMSQLAGRITAVPLTRPWYRGLANVRGKLVSVVDLALFAGGIAAVPSAASRVVLVAERFQFHGALLVDRMVGLRNRARFTVAETAADETRPWLGQTLLDRDGVSWRELDIAALVTEEDFLKAGI
jgi:twitching motility protein PilI